MKKIKKIFNSRGSYYIEALITIPIAFLLITVGLFSILSFNMRNKMTQNLQEASRESITSETYYEAGTINAAEKLREYLSLYDESTNPDGWYVHYVQINDTTGTGTKTRMTGVEPPVNGVVPNYANAGAWFPSSVASAKAMNDNWKIGNELEIVIWRPMGKSQNWIVNSFFTINFFEQSFKVVEDIVIVSTTISIENDLK